MKCFLWTLVFSLLLVSNASFAEFYKYRDENGVIRFTDNILEVPRSQQENVEAYREIKNLEKAEEAADVESMADIKEKLQAQKMILDKEYEGLMAERQTLEEEAKIARTESENDAFEKKIKDFNLRIQQYDEKRILFKAKGEAFNERLDAQFK